MMKVTVFDIDEVIGDIADDCDGYRSCIVERIVDEFGISVDDADELFDDYIDWWNKRIEHDDSRFQTRITKFIKVEGVDIIGDA